MYLSSIVCSTQERLQVLPLRTTCDLHQRSPSQPGVLSALMWLDLSLILSSMPTWFLHFLLPLLVAPLPIRLLSVPTSTDFPAQQHPALELLNPETTFPVLPNLCQADSSFKSQLHPDAS